MKNKSWYLLACLAGALVAFGTTVNSSTGKSYIDLALESGNSYLIRNVSYFDGEKFYYGNHNILIVDGFIEKICPPPKAKDCLTAAKDLSPHQFINAQGQYLVPGFINAEAHVVNPKELFQSFATKNIGAIKDNEGNELRPPISQIFRTYAKEGQFVEINNHQLYWGHDTKGYQLGESYPITESSGMEKPLRFGVTTIFDMHSRPSFTNYFARSRNKIEANPKDKESVDLQKEFLLYPDTYTSGMWAHAPNLHYFLFGSDPVYNLAPAGPWDTDDIKQWIQRRKTSHSDYIKVYYDDKNGEPNRPRIDSKTLETLIEVAHKQDLKVIAHALSLREAREAVELGADGTMHTVIREGQVANEEFIAAYKKSKTFNIPTLNVMVGACDAVYSITNRWSHRLGTGGFLGQYFESEKVRPYVNYLDDLRNQNCYAPYPDSANEHELVFKNVGRLLEAGVPVLAGTDSGEANPTVEGVNLHYEAYLIAEAAYLHGGPEYENNRRAANIVGLKSMTSEPAKSFFDPGKSSSEKSVKGHKRGFIKEGYRADLVLLNANPEIDILNTLEIDSVFKGGFQINRSMQKVR